MRKKSKKGQKKYDENPSSKHHRHSIAQSTKKKLLYTHTRFIPGFYFFSSSKS